MGKKRYIQGKGIDFDEIFVVVASLKTVRLLVAIVAHEGWKVYRMNVISDFLNDDLEEDIYVVQ